MAKVYVKIDDALDDLRVSNWNSVKGNYLSVTKKQFSICKDWGKMYYSNALDSIDTIYKYTALNVMFYEFAEPSSDQSQIYVDFLDYLILKNYTNKVDICEGSTTSPSYSNEKMYTLQLISLVKLRELVEDYGERIVKLILRNNQ